MNEERIASRMQQMRLDGAGFSSVEKMSSGATSGKALLNEIENRCDRIFSVN